jgi:hypothetical protein
MEDRGMDRLSSTTPVLDGEELPDPAEAAEFSNWIICWQNSLHAPSILPVEADRSMATTWPVLFEVREDEAACGYHVVYISDSSSLGMLRPPAE